MIFVCTMAYNRPDFVREGLEHWTKTQPRDTYDRHVLVDPGYPIPSVEDNRKAMKALAEEFNVEYLPIDNISCHGNWQHVLDYYSLQGDDIFVTACPDSRGSPGWVKAAAEVIRADKSCFTVQLNRRIDYTPWNPMVVSRGGHEVLQFPQLIAWSTGLFRVGDVRLAGGFKAYAVRYGYVEHYLIDQLLPKGKTWFLLYRYFDEVPESPDKKFVKWKVESAGKITELDFAEWLKINPA